MFNSLSIVIATVSDMDASVAFYRDIVGFPLRHASPEWSEFGTPGCTFALHAADMHRKAQPGGVTIGLHADDIDGAYNALIEKGVHFLMPPTMQDFGGKLALFTDPDGYIISIAGPH